MWRSTFVPGMIFRRSIRLKQTDRTCWTIQTHSDELNWASSRTFHELHSQSLVRLMKSSTFGLGLRPYNLSNQSLLKKTILIITQIKHFFKNLHFFFTYIFFDASARISFRKWKLKGIFFDWPRMLIYWVGLSVPPWLLVVGVSRKSLLVGGFWSRTLIFIVGITVKPGQAFPSLTN